MPNLMPPITAMDAAERDGVHQLLRSCHLPLDGFDDGHVQALVAKDDLAIVGSAAIEEYGRFGLLRSVAVAESYRGRGLGHALANAAILLARARDLTALYLLTETASAFFPRFGFVPVARADIPNEVRESVEFTSVCPSSAQAFVLSLKGDSQ